MRCFVGNVIGSMGLNVKHNKTVFPNVIKLICTQKRPKDSCMRIFFHSLLLVVAQPICSPTIWFAFICNDSIERYDVASLGCV